MRYVLDFGGGLVGAPSFAILKDLFTLQDLAPPPLVPLGGNRFYFETTFPLAASPGTSAVVFLATGLDGLGNPIDLDDVVSTGGGVPPGFRRYVLAFGRTLVGQQPRFDVFQDLLALAPLPASLIYEIGLGLFYFDVAWPLAASPTTTAIDYVASTPVGGLLSDVLSIEPLVPTQPSTVDPAQSPGLMSLKDLKDAVREASDTENDPHIGDAELARYVNQSAFELYDMLVAAYGDDYFVAPDYLFTPDGKSDQVALPDGTDRFRTAHGDVAGAFYKLIGVDYSTNGGQPGGWVPLESWNVGERGRYGYGPAYLAGAQLKVRLRGTALWFNAVPPQQVHRVLYVPRMTPLLDDRDLLDGVSGWTEYVIVDAALKCVRKQERDPSALMAQKAALKARIDSIKQNRDAGRSKTVQRTRRNHYGTDAAPGAFGPFGGSYR